VKWLSCVFVVRLELRPCVACCSHWIHSVILCAVVQVSEQEFQAQFDAFNALLAHAHTEIRRTRFVPLGIVLLGVVMCVLAVVVAVSASNKHERGPIWPVAVGVPLLAVGLAGVYVTRRRRSILVDQCVEALDARVGVLNSTTYQRAGLEWRATVVSACVEVAGRTRMVRLPVIELDINMSLHYAMQYVDYVPRPTPSGSVFDSDGDFLPVGSSMLQPAAPALLAPDVSGSGSDTDMA